MSYASEIIELLNMEGLLAVEFFIDAKGEAVIGVHIKSSSSIDGWDSVRSIL